LPLSPRAMRSPFVLCVRLATYLYPSWVGDPTSSGKEPRSSRLSNCAGQTQTRIWAHWTFLMGLLVTPHMGLLVTLHMGLVATIPTTPVNSGGCNTTESYYTLHLSSTPSSTARTAACVRSETPSLQMTLRTCFLTVLTLISSFRAICWFA
jgi:hypothetical protein